MAATAIAAIGLGLSAASAAGQAVYTSQAVAASRKAERLREQMMRSETNRRQRELIRQSLVANSVTRARAVAQGAGLGSSAVSGAYGQTAGDVGRQSTGLFENQVLGSGIFKAGRDMADAQGMAATLNQAGQFGNFLMSNAVNIKKIGTTLFGDNTPTTQESWNFGTSTSYAQPYRGSFNVGPRAMPEFM